MHLVFIGTGYVGLVTGTCFAEMGHSVTCLDTDAEKIARIKAGSLPIYEPGLDEIVLRNVEAGRLFFTTKYAECIPTADALFFCLPTPAHPSGACDVRCIYEAAEHAAKYLRDYTVLIMKSTVPVGTTKALEAFLIEQVEQLGASAAFDVVSNPEFLKEGNAVDDCMKPDRVVIGVESERAKALMRTIYSPFTLNHNRLVFMDIASSELTKYAANAMLATRISFMNELSHLCEKVGADINQIRIGIGSDSRIGYSFLYAGPGYGGSCFPKDIKALAHTAATEGVRLEILQAVDATNEKQKNALFTKLYTHFADKGGLSGKTIAVWGLAFKPNTDDVRDAPALTLIEKLVAAGATVHAYDPIASENAQKSLAHLTGVHYFDSEYKAANTAHAIALVTEWKQFQFVDFTQIQRVMQEWTIVDGRNRYTPSEMREMGFTYYGIGIPQALEASYAIKRAT